MDLGALQEQVRQEGQAVPDSDPQELMAQVQLLAGIGWQ